MEKKIVNHVIFAIDSSSSMRQHSGKVNQLFREFIKAEQASQIGESTLSYLHFGTTVTQVLTEVPIQTITEPPLVIADGWTALVDGVYEAISGAVIRNLRNNAKSDEDHSFLLYVISDGEENRSKRKASDLAELIRSLDDSWTICSLVPSVRESHKMKLLGFPAGNIQVWDANSSYGMDEVITTITDSMQAYSAMRSTGVRSSANLFNVKVPKAVDKSQLETLDNVSTVTYSVDAKTNIKDFIEKVTGKTYTAGSTYYKLEKTEIVQASKDIIVYEKSTGKKYGGRSARAVLGIPAGVQGRVSPNIENQDFDIYVQSMSFNRNVFPGNQLMVVK